ncbi:hypothetical protein PGT21_004315 [Puccinia graminis f. sp. tritici]|uniref:Uncharacterized protein n=1 Tax=Puccinia graminis f. sp. tritici TaxID=56615 RepID=A0A5B0LJ11_PUCGR|nr:hypothetical protein PGTUg99_015991 [Puccinia graminis f. sp. tritici]KAA1103022.1 hypothetical protein PGT21_004315 [Puccinia graminis f. sp. tritici]
MLGRYSVGLANLSHCADMRDVRPCLDPRPGNLEWRRRLNVAVGGMSRAVFLVLCGRAAFEFSPEENTVWEGDSGIQIRRDVINPVLGAFTPHNSASSLRSFDLIELD